MLPDETIKTREDVEEFMSKKISETLPLDYPQWRLYIQGNKYLGDKGIGIWKSHHSFADGVSSMALDLQVVNNYDKKNLIPFKEITLWNRCLIRAMFPIYLPIILWESYLRRKDKNPLHPKGVKLTGDNKIVLSKQFDF